jgi:hypothetical protein
MLESSLLLFRYLRKIQAYETITLPVYLFVSFPQLQTLNRWPNFYEIGYERYDTGHHHEVILFGLL